MEFIMYGKIYPVMVTIEPDNPQGKYILATESRDGEGGYTRQGATLGEALEKLIEIMAPNEKPFPER